MHRIANWICDVLEHVGDAATEQRVRAEVARLTEGFPLYIRRWRAAGGAA
jgi:glycine/serine hydroxymethyltransferase